MGAAVPVIDLRHATPAAIDSACREIGFLVVTGHGVPADLVARMHAVSAVFFQLPMAEKRRLQVTTGRIHGWTGPAQSYLADTLGAARAPDLKEGFSIGPVDTPPDLTAQEAPYFGRNLWPDRPEGFIATWTAYYRAMEGLAQRLMTAFAGALVLPHDQFDGDIDRHITGLAVHHYPPQPVAAAPGQMRAGAHTDFGSLTILHTGEAPGLQVLAQDGGWQDVVANADSFVVNIGDLMAQWTSDRWVSTLHRVQNPPPDRAHLPRQSITFFHQPNWHAVIDGLGGTPSRAAPTTSGAHFERKLALLRKAASAG